MKSGYGLDFLSHEVLPKKVSTFKPNPTLKRIHIHGDGNKNQCSRFQGRTSINVYFRKFQKTPLFYFPYTYCIFFKPDIADRGQILGETASNTNRDFGSMLKDQKKDRTKLKRNRNTQLD